ncbi:hypothetical protein KZP23_08710 [Echinicola marina]|uniref:hypothetical protein n=1 Tax=Echinicola marina TaxID=2859768 RepID=UPI001CF71324|nr:hypothetical protein [Echinicola marina]UCS95075.1 hypothetical protein KZP23_08710 [Echinicola marina]
MKKNTLIMALLALGTTGFLSSCNNDDSDEMPQANITVKARAVTESNSEENNGLISGASITSADFSFGNLSIIGNSNSSGSVQLPLEQAMSYSLNLIQSALPQSETLGSLSLDAGSYTGITLQFQQDDALMETDVLFEKSINIQGNVNGQLLNIYTDTEEMLTAAADGGNLQLEGNQDIYLNFDLNRLFENIDLGLAVDGNSNGIIEIEPNNLDGNRNIYLTMMGNLEKALYISKN